MKVSALLPPPLPPLLFLPSLFLCILLPFLLLRLRSSSRCRRPRPNLPPGPRPLPIVGHLHLLGSNPHHSLSSLSQSYGPLMFLRLGSIPVIVASSPAMARQILQAHDHIFSSRFQPSASAHLTHGCPDVFLSQPGPYWKLMRRICLTDLFDKKRMQSFRPLIAEEVHALLRSVLDTADHVHLREKLYEASNNIISRIFVGKRLVDLELPSQAHASSNIVALLVNFVRLLGVFNVGDFIPALAWMDLQGCARQSKAVAQKLAVLWQAIIDGRREARRRSDTTVAGEKLDFLDDLLTACEHKDVAVTDYHIMSMLSGMFAAGTDTSTISTEWALSELISNPSKMQKLQDELEQVVGRSRLVQETDIPNLPYLHAVVKETLRLHPVAPLLIHKASQECQVSGYDIPKDALAYVNVWAIGRDPSIWERPLEFWPERFLECSTDVRGHHFELLPFGSGRRVCLGLALGLGSVQFMLASLVHCFEWSSREKLDMTEMFQLVAKMEKPLVATVTPRVPTNLLLE